jgi:hypothetical protein
MLRRSPARTLQRRQAKIEPAIVPAILDDATRMRYRRPIASEHASDRCETQAETDMREINGDLSGEGHLRCTARRLQQG